MKFQKYLFRIAGLYGLLVTLPLYFAEQKVNTDYPPAITHPEYYYAFAGVTLVWQILFFVIARDPVRFRPFMILSVLEKLSLVPAYVILSPRGLFPQIWLPMIGIDLTFAVLFTVAFFRTDVKPAGS